MVASAAVADEARRGVHLRRAVAPRPRCRRPVSDQHRAVRLRPRRRGRRAGPARPSWSAIRWARCTRGVWPRSGPSWSARSWSRTWRRTSAAAPPARGSRGCTRCRPNSVRPKRFTTSSGQWPGSTSSRRSTGPRRAGGCTGTPSDWIEIAAEWGTRDYWQQWKAVRVPALLLEAGNSVTPAGADAQNGGNRLPDNVFARARCRSPDPRRCAADLSRGGRVVPSDARPRRLRPARTAAAQSVCGSASTSCATRKPSRSSSNSRPDIGADQPELVEADSKRVGAMGGPAERRCHREGGDQDEKGECSGHGSNTPLDKYPANSGRKDTLR